MACVLGPDDRGLSKFDKGNFNKVFLLGGGCPCARCLKCAAVRILAQPRRQKAVQSRCYLVRFRSLRVWRDTI